MRDNPFSKGFPSMDKQLQAACAKAVKAKENNIMNFEALKKNLIDVIKESQIKIGYSNTPIGLYYPLSSLNCFLGTTSDASEMTDLLADFADYAEDTLGRIEISNDDDRFCIKVPKEGVTYVHENVEDSGFLREFIGLVSTHGKQITLDDILDVFRKYSDCVKCIPVNDDEFDHLIYFEDGDPDNFRYCVKLEHCHAVYHRFTPQDFDQFGFEIVE